MRKLKNDLTGRRFGRLTVIGYHENGGRKTSYVCQCDCGNVKVIRGDALTSGATKSCGCLKKEQDKENLGHNQTHCLSGTRLYTIWQGMKDRCGNKNNPRYQNYGGRGITVCKEWEKDFLCFYNWAVSHGYSNSLTIDRIDNGKGYFPENCRWADCKTQSNNRRSNVNITIGNSTRTLKEWCEIFAVDYKRTAARYERSGFEGIDRLFNDIL